MVAKYVLLTGISAVLLSLTAQVAMADTYINGVLLSSQQLAAIEQTYGKPMPSGHYWLNFKTGAWGYGDRPARRAHVTRYRAYEDKSRYFTPRPSTAFTPGSSFTYTR